MTNGRIRTNINLATDWLRINDSLFEPKPFHSRGRFFEPSLNAPESGGICFDLLYSTASSHPMGED